MLFKSIIPSHKCDVNNSSGSSSSKLTSKSWFYHSHMKRNSLDTRAVLIEFLEYVNSSGEVVYWGDRSFSRTLGWRWHWRNFVFLDNNMLIATVTAERFRDLVCSYCLKYSRIIQNAFLIKISEKRYKTQR